ncbi:glycosyltransferase family 2 protein [Domibacillus mangrovi]|uniref:Glycosyl transferase n=1 Tax=Domibacillus mangrovi TaxID=1714354 RepID=A0A1Q5P6Q5_9BACI|nr:glycosyltransferase [Domibacillus mangrovi]OKL37858.1 glycosyl transferase [Domibacillus mangrovi]
MSTFTSYLLLFFGGIIFVYMLLVIFSYSTMFLYALLQLRKEYKLDKHESDEELSDITYVKPVSIIVPAYNEEAGILDSVHSLLSLSYPQMEVIVVNDGSSDKTQDKMIAHFQMEPIQKVIRQQLDTKPVTAVYRSTIHPNLLFITKQNGGKADALNAGINLSKYPYFCSVDGDSILESTSLLKVMKPIITSNEEVIASGGSIRIANGTDIQMGSVMSVSLSEKSLVIMQVIEYLRAFLVGRVALSKHNMVLIISGAFSVFSKKWVIEAGGYLKSTVGEDMELVVRLHRMIKEQKSSNRIEFVPDPVCWTEAPENIKGLRRQRARWHRGLLESLWKHRKMTLNPKYGAVGMISFPYFWLIECLGPLIELGGYIYIVYAFFTGGIYFEFAIVLVLLFILYGSVFSMISVLFEAWSLKTYPKITDLIRLFMYSFTEVFWYRPLTIFWRCEGILQFFLKRDEWGHMERRGLSRKGLEE